MTIDMWALDIGLAHPFDFRTFLVPGDASLRQRSFRTFSESRKDLGLGNTERVAFITGLLQLLRQRSFTKDTRRRAASHIAQFVSCIDSSTLTLSRSNALECVRHFDESAKQRWTRACATWVAGAVARMLGEDVRSFRTKMLVGCNTNWIVDFKEDANLPFFDFRALLTPKTTALRFRAFNRLPDSQKNAGSVKDARGLWIADLCACTRTTVESQSISMSGFRNELFAVWRLTKRMDEAQLPVSRPSVFACLSNGAILRLLEVAKHRVTLVRLLTRLELTPEEKAAIQSLRELTSTYVELRNDSPWVIDFRTCGHAIVDLRVAINPSDLAAGHRAFRSRTEEYRSACADGSSRSLLVEKLRNYLKQHLAEGTSSNTVYGVFSTFTTFMRWHDATGEPLSLANLLEVYAAFSAAHSAKVAAGTATRFSAHSTRVKLTPAIASILGTTSAVVSKGLVPLPAKDTSGRSGPYVGSSNVADYTAWLDAIISIISIDLVDSDLTSGLAITYKGSTLTIPGASALWRNRAPNRFLNIRMVTARIEAELSRFVALTGANKSVALGIRIEDLKWAKDFGGYRVGGYKDRKGGNVHLYIPTQYRPALERHIQFLHDLLGHADDSDKLFPFLAVGGPSSLVAATRMKQSIQFRRVPEGTERLTLELYFKAATLPHLTLQQLRFAKGDNAHSAAKGDPLRASRILGNTPAVAWRHYGGRGNLPLAQREMTAFWEALSSIFRIAIAPGLCVDSGVPAPLDANHPPPLCGSENACFYCRQYRGIDALDYVHLILTRIFELRIMTAAEPARADEFLSLVGVLEQIIESYLALHPDQLPLVATLRKSVDAGNLHDNLRNSIVIYRKLFPHV